MYNNYKNVIEMLIPK